MSWLAENRDPPDSNARGVDARTLSGAPTMSALCGLCAIGFFIQSGLDRDRSNGLEADFSADTQSPRCFHMAS